MEDISYARIIEKDGALFRQLLIDHLQGVANRASSFAADFNSSDWAYLAGLWHDLGKYQSIFQDKLNGSNISVEHSGLGAALAFDKFKETALPIAYTIAGHHTGLTNRVESGADLPLPLMERIRANKELIAPLINLIPDNISNQKIPALPEQLQRSVGNLNKAGSIEFWIRFIFSALVDADRLDAEFFDDPKKQLLRGSYFKIADLNLRLDQYIENKIKNIPASNINLPVNKVRRMVLDACKEKAKATPGIFSLNVPTGGGKTLSAMCFALKHGVANSLNRVIVVIPYTSIIEQNAAVYKEALGDENVIEHHSAYDPQNEKSEIEADRYQAATENWDAPVIVTTSVQFFETLFSSKPGACRKLHNISRSVIILDEVQTLPPGLLDCILDAINELTSNYGCSVVLSTATPPALAERPDFTKGLKGIQSIITNPQELAAQLHRVQYTWPAIQDEAVKWPVLATKIAAEKQVLAIVDRRNDARELAQEVSRLCKNDLVYHLSALMCPAHRLDVIKHIKDALWQGLACRVISTQVVEAGVDIDFPVVYRAMAGLSSIVQAAGRCNREGKLGLGQLIVFRPPDEPPAGSLRTAKQITDNMLKMAATLNVDDIEVIEKYFRQLYFTQELDKYGIQSDRSQLNFANVGKKFHLIEDGFTNSIVVPYEEASSLLANIRQFGPSRINLRKLQRYIVNIYPNFLLQLNKLNVLEEIAEGIFFIKDTRFYNPMYGLVMGDEVEPMAPLII